MLPESDDNKKPLLDNSSSGDEDASASVPAAAPTPAVPLPLGYKKILWETAKLAGPIILSRAADMLSGIAAAVILARYSEDTMVASGLIIGTQVPFLFAGSSPLLAGSVLIGKTYGAIFRYKYQNNMDEVKKLKKSIGSMFQQSMLMSIPLNLIPLILIWNVKPILLSLGQEKKYVEIVQNFYKGYIYSVPGLMSMSSMRQFCYATGNQWVPLLNGFLDLAILAVPGYFLVNGGLGLTGLGARGMGYAYIIQAYLGLAIYTLCFCVSHDIKSYSVFKKHALNKFNHILAMAKIGWPIALNVIGETAVLFASSIIAGQIGPNTLSAQLVVGQYMPLTLIPVFSLQQTATIQVAQARGMRQFVNLKHFGNSNIIIAGTFIGLFFIVTLAASKQLSLPFMRNHYENQDEVLKIVSSLMPLTFLGQILDAIRNTAIGGMRGYGDTVTPTLMSLSCLWFIGMGLGYLLAKEANLGIDGLVGGYAGGLLIAATTMILRWNTQTDHFITTNSDEMLPMDFPTLRALKNYCLSIFDRSTTEPVRLDDQLDGTNDGYRPAGAAP